jgi:5'-nucleotidase
MSEFKPRPIVLVDMDGVLFDFDKSALSILPASVLRVPRKNFYVADDYPDHAALIKERCAEPDFFEELELIDGALDGWERMLEAGFNPQICSSPLSSNRNAIEGKIKALDKHFVPRFGAQVVERAIIDKQKYKYPGAILLDDRPDVEKRDATWQHVVFDRPYNQLSTAALRLMGWYDPLLEEKLMSIAA